MSEAEVPPAPPREGTPSESAATTPVVPLVREPVGGEPEAGRVCQVQLEEFEGPLDLLLHLVRRHELDILNIPIAFVCEKYLEYIDFMQALDLEVAGDYLVMAATLAYLKSRELVPQQEELSEEGEIEEGPDPREQLIMRLLEYQKFKEAARRLDKRPIAGRDTFARGQTVELPPVDAGLAPITLFRLAEAYSRVLERARIHRSHEVVMEGVSVAERMQQLTGLLLERSHFDFEALFLERSWATEGELRSMLVVTLMSVLELVRMGVARVHQPLGTDTIRVERVANEEEARAALKDYDESISFGSGKPSPGDGDEDDDDDGEPLDVAAEDVPAEGVTAEDARVTDPLSDPDPADAVDVEPAPEQTPEPTSEPPPEPVVAADAGVSGRSVVSESPSPDAVGVAEAEPRAEGPSDASEQSEGDGQEHGENGEAQAVEGS